MKSSSIRMCAWGVALLVPMAVDFGVVRPGRLQAREKQAAIHAIDEQLAAVKEKTSALVEQNQRVDRLEHGINAVEARLPSEAKVDDVVAEIGALAAANHLQDARQRVTGSGTCGGYPERCVELSASGSFGSLYAFLSQLEALPQIVRVEGLELRRCGDGASALMTLGISFQK